MNSGCVFDSNILIYHINGRLDEAAGTGNSSRKSAVASLLDFRDSLFQGVALADCANFGTLSDKQVVLFVENSSKGSFRHSDHSCCNHNLCWTQFQSSRLVMKFSKVRCGSRRSPHLTMTTLYQGCTCLINHSYYLHIFRKSSRITSRPLPNCVSALA